MKKKFCKKSKLMYLDSDIESSKYIIFLHGFPESKESWLEYTSGLKNTYRCFAIDLPGFGESPEVEGLAGVEYFEYIKNALVVFIEELYLSKSFSLTLVGHDWGGIIAQYLCANYAHFFTKLVLLNSPHPKRFLELHEASHEQRYKSRYIDFICSKEFPLLERSGGYQVLRFSLFDDSSCLSNVQKQCYLDYWSKPGRLESMTKIYTLVDFFDSLPMPVISVPTHIFWGLKDHALSKENIDGLLNFFTSVRIYPIDNRDHWTNHVLLPEMKDVFCV